MDLVQTPPVWPAPVDLEAENAALRAALRAEREKNMRATYCAGIEQYGHWTHCGLPDGKQLAFACGLDPDDTWYDAAVVKETIPIAAEVSTQFSEARP